MPELTQGMIDAGAAFFDANGVPTKPDGTPIAGWGYEGAPIGGGVLGAIAQQNASDVPFGGNLEAPGVADEQGAFYSNPLAFKSRSNSPEGAYPPIFGSGAPPAGWFSLDDYYKLTNPRPPIPEGYDQFNPANNADNPAFAAYDNWSPVGTPQSISRGSDRPSTNDWRLLPPPYNTPNFFMMNGQIIDRAAAGRRPANAAGAPYPGSSWGGSNFGVPFAFNAGGNVIGFGFPGSLEGWDYHDEYRG